VGVALASPEAAKKNNFDGGGSTRVPIYVIKQGAIVDIGQILCTKSQDIIDKI